MPHLPPFFRPGASAPNPSPAPNPTPIPFVPPGVDTPLILLHGSWLGTWYWRQLAHILRYQYGFRIFAPTMQGYGTAVPPLHLTWDEVVDQLVDELETDGITGAYILAHSLAGIPAQLLTSKAEHRIAGACFFDAFVARPGEALLDLHGTAGPDFIAGLRSLRDPDLNAMRWPFEMFRTILMPDGDEDYARHIYARLTTQPWDLMEEKVDTTRFWQLIAGDGPDLLTLKAPLPVRYIFAPHDQGPAPDYWLSMALRLGAVAQYGNMQYIQLQRGDHMAMLLEPQALADAVLLAVDPARPDTALASRLDGPPAPTIPPVVDADAAPDPSALALSPVPVHQPTGAPFAR